MSSQKVPPLARGPVLWERLGPALTSRNLWIVIAAFEVFLTLLSTFPGDVRRPLWSVLGGALASAAMLGVVVSAWLLLLRRMAGLARVAATVPVLVLAGLTRGAVFQWCLVSWGMSEPGASGMRYRIFGSIVVVTTGAFLGALVKVGVEEHRRRLEELQRQQERLALVLRQSEGELRRDQSEAIDTITSSLIAELTSLRSHSPALAANQLDRVAEQVIRPLSHELGAAAPTWQPPQPAQTRISIDWGQVWSEMASLSSLNPLGPAIVILVVIPSSSFNLGLRQAVLLHVAAAVLIFLGLVVLRRSIPTVGPGLPTGLRLAATTVLLVIACAPAAAYVWWMSPPDLRGVHILYALLVVPFVALLFAFFGAARAQQQAIDAELEGLVRETNWWVTRTRMVLWWQNGALARALHGPVQTAILAAAARIRRNAAYGTADTGMLDSEIDDMSRTLADVVMPRERPGGFHQQVADLAVTWRALVEVQVDSSEASSTLIDGDPIVADIAANVIAEAISNASRHGASRRVVVRIDVQSPAELHIAVDDDGCGRATIGEVRGLGTAQLDACALEWDYRTVEQGNRLQVTLPLLLSRPPTADADAAVQMLS